MRKKYVLVHHYCETGFNSIVAFSDSYNALVIVAKSHPRFSSSRHIFRVYENVDISVFLTDIKDKCLINICKNVAEYLSVGEYAILKKSYFKSSVWFEKAKNSASLGADIIDNY